jgi:RNA polymerase sigma-70 factor (ECF subfamily)
LEEGQNNIIRQFQDGDHRAFSLLYDKYSNALYGVAFNIMLDEASAQDVLQDALVKAWKNRQKYDPRKGTFFTWLMNIVRFTAIDAIRSKKAKKDRNEKIQNQHTTVYPHGQTDESWKPEYVGLLEMTRNLDEKYREVLDLVYLHGFTHQEVHEFLDIPLGTVKTRVRKALKILRGAFGTAVISILYFISTSSALTTWLL